MAIDLGAIDAAEITAVIKTALDPTQIDALIDEAAEWAGGKLEDARIDVATLTAYPKSLRIAVKNYARWLVFTYDASAHLKVPKFREINTTIEFAGQSDKAGAMFKTVADEAMESYLSEASPRRKPKVRRTRRQPGDGAHVDDGTLDPAVTS